MNYQTALVQLPLVYEATKTSIRTPEDAAEICADLKDLAQEAFHVLLLNTRNRLINRQMVSLGIVDATLVHPREIFRPAFLQSAVSIVLVHNHPSGDPSPSAEDIKLTRQMIQVGQVMGIKVLDHVIIGRETNAAKGYLSLRESGVCDFDAGASEPKNGKKTEGNKQ